MPFCPNCGSENATGSAHCSNCGVNLNSNPTPPPPVQGNAPAGGYNQPQSNGSFFGALFDLSFQNFVTPKIIKIIYILQLCVLGLAGLTMVIMFFVINPVLGIFGLLILLPIWLFFALIIARMSLEITIVIFNIADDLNAIRENQQNM